MERNAMNVNEVPRQDSAGRLAGKVAVVFGAGGPDSGWSNGSAVSAIFGREGAKVFAVDRNVEAAANTARTISALHGACEVGTADVTKYDEVAGVVEQCVKTFGRIDILYNNVGAGAIGHGGVVETTEEMWRKSVDLNLTSAFFTCKCVLPYMREQRSGSLVHLSSMAAFLYMKDTMAAYSAAKAGLIQMSRTIAMQHITQGIRSNCVIAGYIDTAEIRRRAGLRFGSERVDEVMAIRGSVIPPRKAGSVWDIAHAVLYLASDESSYVTATELFVDGGTTTAVCDSYGDKIPERPQPGGIPG
jgi:NAD(P)-dependent dehydrogenase (short-subunit alcohol dehydrogenase family)